MRALGRIALSIPAIVDGTNAVGGGIKESSTDLVCGLECIALHFGLDARLEACKNFEAAGRKIARDLLLGALRAVSGTTTIVRDATGIGGALVGVDLVLVAKVVLAVASMTKRIPGAVVPLGACGGVTSRTAVLLGLAARDPAAVFSRALLVSCVVTALILRFARLDATTDGGEKLSRIGTFGQGLDASSDTREILIAGLQARQGPEACSVGGATINWLLAQVWAVRSHSNAYWGRLEMRRQRDASKPRAEPARASKTIAKNTFAGTRFPASKTIARRTWGR
jgi:hypothetical protein